VRAPAQEVLSRRIAAELYSLANQIAELFYGSRGPSSSVALYKALNALGKRFEKVRGW